MHSNKDLSTTTPLVLHHDRDAVGSTVEAYDDGGPEHGDGARMLAVTDVEDELEEIEPGPSDVNGG